MKRTGIAFFALAFACLGFFYAWVKLRADSDESNADEPAIIRGTTQKHFVTPAMLASSSKMAEQVAPGFQSEATDGKGYRLETLVNEGPLVLIFIKDGCPCSLAAQVYFNRLHNAYGSRLPFFGVFDGSVTKAKAWGQGSGVAYPILSDPDLKIVSNYKAENSTYVALITKGGTIEKLWPGYSTEMLKDLSNHVAKLAGVEPKTVDLADAPEEMISGCPYDL